MKSKQNKWLRLLKLPMYEKINRLSLAWYKIKGILFYRAVFGSFGSGSLLYKPMLVAGAQFIHIGKDTMIRKGVRLEAVVIDPANPPEIRIGNNVNIEQDVHIVAIGKIYIRDNVSLTARTSILCGTHPFFDIQDPQKIGNRVSGTNTFVEIGEGSFLGINSMVQMNVRIGKHVVVASHAIVKKSVPDYCVVDGNPASVVLKYDAEQDRWLRPAKK